MPYNFAADSFHTKKLCSRLFSSEVRFYKENGRFAFFRPLSGDMQRGLQRGKSSQFQWTDSSARSGRTCQIAGRVDNLPSHIFSMSVWQQSCCMKSIRLALSASSKTSLFFQVRSSRVSSLCELSSSILYNSSSNPEALCSNILSHSYIK